MEEVWEDIPGYLGFYASNLGGIKNGLTGKIRKFSLSHGYHVVNLDNIRNQFVHRLIALTFLPNPENKPQVDHIDGNPLNNNLNNLRWATVEEQAVNKCKRKNVGNNPHWSKYKGVIWDKEKNKWQWNLKFKGIWHRGRCETELEAGKAYHNKAKEVCGEWYRGQPEFPELEE